MEGSNVRLLVYDLSFGMGRALSAAFLGRQLDGIWHTSVAAYETEYFFGSQGIQSCAIYGTVLGKPSQEIDLGFTEIPFDYFVEYLSQLGESTFRPNDYDLFHHNCNTFSSEVCQFLTNKDIPQFVKDLPNEILSTPLGQQIATMMSQFRMLPQ